MHDGESPGRQLYAFYDLEFSPATFDFLTWLLHAEMRRRELKCAGIHVVFVPGCQDDSNPNRYRTWVARWRLSNVCISACRLVPSVIAITTCASRFVAGEIENANPGRCFPSEYTTQLYQSAEIYESSRTAMADSWILGRLVVRHFLGDEIPVLRPSGKAVAFIRGWLGKRSGGRKIIVMTLRETQFDTSRNVKANEWLRFAYALDPATYFPVIVRDTEQLYRAPGGYPGLATCPAASLDIDIRAALYEAAYLNLTVNSGPLALCWLNPSIPYIAYRYFSNSNEYGVIPHVEIYGVPTGGSHPFAHDLQRLVWDTDSYSVIAETFDEMVERIEASDATMPRDKLQRRRVHARKELLAIAVGFHVGNFLTAAETLYRHLIDADPDDADARAMLGLLMYHRGNDTLAARLLLEAIERRRDVAAFFFNLGVVLRRLDRLEESLAAFTAALKLESEPSSATLANIGGIYRQLGRADDAIASYRRAVAAGARDYGTLFEYAATLLEARQSAAACDAFALLRDHYVQNGIRHDERVLKDNPALAPLSGIRSAHYVLPMNHGRGRIWGGEW